MSYKYHHEINLQADSSHTRVIRLVGERKRVLELGCATGYMAKVLVERFGCTVTGVERDAVAAADARKFCSRVVVGDLEALDWDRELSEATFDVIVCADVLEHLRDPARTLVALRRFLGPRGYVVASIPNVAHASVVAELLQGNFTYRPLGLLDEGHVRFFTRQSICECFDQAGLVIVHLERIVVEPHATEFRTDLSRFAPEVVDLLRTNEESLTYQFIVLAEPAPGATAALDPEAATTLGPGLTTPEPGLRTPTSGGEEYWRGRLDGLVQALLARVHFLEDERGRRARELDEARSSILQLAQITSSRAWRLLRLLRRVRRLISGAGGG